MTAHDEDLARRVYSYLVFRLRQPDEAERLTRLTFERFWREAKLSSDPEQEPDLPVFVAARAVMAENPRQRGAVRAAPPSSREGPDRAERRAGDGGRPSAWARADALALRFGAELSVGEIAELLDRTPADVKQRLARGVRSLRDLGIGSAAERPGTGGAEQGEPEQGEPGD